VAQPASYTAGAVASRASRSSWRALIIAWFSEWLTHAKPLPLNVMLVQLTLSLRTTSGSAVDHSTSWEEESAPCLLMGVIVPPGSDRLRAPLFRSSAGGALGLCLGLLELLDGNEARTCTCSTFSASPIGSVALAGCRVIAPSPFAAERVSVTAT